ncbi:unnamed protein product [Chilo suppressalis]|uniref:SAC3/GANP/THP3 conserved domain-containing protein n=1 Tax=Chilo suppressalis TaxID=168631 RepID=A0ABN8LB85_CHISP|nr:unnamed protein product [Chilo suppressalis]
MSYFDFFYNKNIAKNNDTIAGTCYSMCPQDEIDLRVRENSVHILEVIGPVKKLVKSYCRSAADSNMAVPRILRPYSTLKETLEYLLFEVLKRRDVPTVVLYDFINDRLRAIRQDMTIQRLLSKQCACLLEPMIRFYVYFAYRLYEQPINDFDPVLNKKYLLECMKWFLSCCDDMDQKGEDKLEELTAPFSNLNINKNEFDRTLVESLYILCNLYDIHPLLRYLSLPRDLKRDSMLNLSYNIAVANIKGDFINTCRLIDKLCPLTYCAIFLYLPEIQKHALQVLAYGYNSKQLTVPGEVLQTWLRFNNKDETLAVCRHYGLEIKNNAVRFARDSFKKEVPKHQLQQNSLKGKGLTVEDIFTYKRNIL